MSDIIFKTNGEEKFRIPFPTPGTKCPEMKLEIKMTETDISKVLIEGEYATIMGVKYKRVEEPKPRMEAERSGEVCVVFYNKKTYYRIEYTDEFGYVVWWRREKQDDTSRLVMVTDKETERLLEVLWFNEVKGGKYD